MGLEREQAPHMPHRLICVGNAPEDRTGGGLWGHSRRGTLDMPRRAARVVATRGQGPRNGTQGALVVRVTHGCVGPGVPCPHHGCLHL